MGRRSLATERSDERLAAGWFNLQVSSGREDGRDLRSWKWSRVFIFHEHAALWQQ